VWASLEANELCKDFLDRICRFLGWHWSDNPDGTVDIEVKGSIFTTTPNVLILADHLG
jgi:hypothetical protein